MPLVNHRFRRPFRESLPLFPGGLQFFFGHFRTILGLNTHPELYGVTKIAGEPEGGVGADAPLLSAYFIDSHYAEFTYCCWRKTG